MPSRARNQHLSVSMYFLRNLEKTVMAGLLLASSMAVCRAAALAPAGGEYRFLPALAGDQMLPQISFNEKGGYLVTQDNSIDGNGLGIRARKYYPDLAGSRWTFQVNSESLGEQQNARVAMLANGGAVFAWQGSTAQGNRIFVRAIDENSIFTGPEALASSSAVGHQSDPALAVLADQTAVVVWTEWNRDGNMQGVFAQRLSSAGARLGETFQVNTLTRLPQRSPSVTGLKNGTFVIAWVQERLGREAIDIYGRIYRADGQPLNSGVQLNSAERLCANPVVSVSRNGFRAAWSSRKLPAAARVDLGGNEFLAKAEPPDLNSWDVVTKSFDENGNPLGDEATVNGTLRGDQFSPRLTAVGDVHLAVWTSFGQDGADEGVFGRILTADGFDGAEFQVNSRTISKQLHPAVATAGDTVMVAWTSFTGGLPSFDVFAQNYQVSADVALSAPQAPFVSSLSPTTLSVTWPETVTQPVSSYLVYVDDDLTPVETVNGMVTITRPQWQPASTHSVQLAYRTADGRVSPKSAAVDVTTWGADSNNDGLPDDWQSENWGKRWPDSNADSDGDGATNFEEFLAGTDPTSEASVLRMQISTREFGVYLDWNTQAGNFYQLQVTTDFRTWENVGVPRFSSSTNDTLPINMPGQVKYYRVIRMR